MWEQKYSMYVLYKQNCAELGWIMVFSMGCQSAI